MATEGPGGLDSSQLDNIARSCATFANASGARHLEHGTDPK